MHAIVRTALTPVRRHPENGAEQISEEALGSVLAVSEQTEEWAFCRGEDGYEGWVSQGGLLIRESGEAEGWWDDAGGQPAFSIDAVIADDSGHTLVRLPWGARVAVRDGAARLPDGRSGRLAGGRWVAWEEMRADYPQEGAAVLATAMQWMGVPYVWGGRTLWGTDCSGFVQAVYRLHGFLLPRDSHQQAEIGEPIGAGTEYEGIVPGDLLYFRGRESADIVHVALSMGGSAILHAAEANGSVREDDLRGSSDLQKSLSKQLVGVKRLFWLSA